MSLFNLIFPKRCVNCRKFGDYICSDCFSMISFADTGTCFVCQRPSINFMTHPKCQGRYEIDGVFSSFLYKGVVKKLVYKFKYNPHLTDLKKELIELFFEGIIQNEILSKLLDHKSIFVPIPLHDNRYRKRGYNQSELLSQGMSKKLGIPLLNLLKRVKNTKTQVGLKKDQRAENIKDAFVLNPKFDIKKSKFETNLKNQNSNSHKLSSYQIFLVDDVVTSGATLLEAAKVLKKSGVSKVYGLTLAHGE